MNHEHHDSHTLIPLSLPTALLPTQVKEWINGRAGKEVHVPPATGKLDTFLVEPFVPHKQEQELYLCIHSVRAGDEFLFYHEGGVDVGDVDAKASRLVVPPGTEPSIEAIKTTLLGQLVTS